MTSLQEYLNQKYPTLEAKEQVTEIITAGFAEQLEGGALDLREFKNLEEVIITNLTTPLTKIEVDGLTKLKELVLPPEETAEEKQLYAELGISEAQEKQALQEINRLIALFTQKSKQEIKVHFATAKFPQAKLGDQNGLIEKNEDGSVNLYLNLASREKSGNFYPPLLFWTLAQQLTKINHLEISPDFWFSFSQELEWIKDNLNEEYQKEFELLLNPSTFPTDKLEISELLAVYYDPSLPKLGTTSFPNIETIVDGKTLQTMVNQEIVDKTWSAISQEILQLTSQEVQKNPSEEERKKLALKVSVERTNQDYTILVNYHANSPLQEKFNQLITTTPLQLENDNLKKEKAQLPTPENFTKLTKQIQVLEDYLLDILSEEEYEKLKEKINQIK